jgi:membrane protein required for colicin V production
MHALTPLDILVMIFVGGGALLGAMRGFVYEVLSLFAWAAVVIALKFLFAPVALMFGHYLGTSAGGALLAFAVVGGFVYIVARMIAARIGARTRQSILGPVDRLLGLGFGGIKGLIGVTLLFMAGNLVYDLIHGGLAPRPDWVSQSRTYPVLQASRRAIDDLVEYRLHPKRQQDGNAAEGNSTRRADGPT